MCGDMCGDIGTCCYGLFCTPCLYGRNYAEFHDVGCCGACCLYCWCWCLVRTACVLRAYVCVCADPSWGGWYSSGWVKGERVKGEVGG